MINRMITFQTMRRWPATVLARSDRHRQRLLRVTVCVGTIVASAWFAPQVASGNRWLSYVWLMYMALAAGLVFLKWPTLGLLAIIPAGFYVPLEIGTGTGTSLAAPILLVILLSGLWIGDMIVRQRQLTFVNSRPLLALGIFVGVAALAFGIGQLPWFPLAARASLAAQIGGLSVFVISGLATALVAHQIRDVRWLQLLVWSLAICGAIYMSGRLVPALGTAALLQRGAHGSLLWTWVVAIPLCQAVFNKDLKPHWRLALLGLVLATLYVGWFMTRRWASGWVPPLAVVLLVIWFRSWRLGLVVTVLGVTTRLILDPSLVTDLLTADSYSINTRLIAWQLLLEMVRVNPLLGFGPANYYSYSALFPILGWYVPFNSHSQYVDLIAQTGLLGLVCFFWVAAEMARLGWRLRTQVSGGFELAYVYGTLAGLGGSLVAGVLGDWVLPFVYNVRLTGMRASLLLWLFLGGLIALEQIVRARRAT
jgi:O-antigen ligase